MKVLAISGSLRAASINSAFCRAAARLAPEGMSIRVLAGLGDLPLFNPDLEDNPPASVRALRSSIGSADALLIASPEYAHGISSVIKNALDWLVSFEGFVAKPIAVVNTSPRARHAYDGLREVLLTMSATLVPNASITLPLLGACVTEDEMVNSPTIAPRITRALAALADALASGKESGPSFPVD
jgi:chromate reductase